jgi:catalase
MLMMLIVDFEQPRVLWQKVFDDGAKQRFIKNVAGHLGGCKKKEIIARQREYLVNLLPINFSPHLFNITSN